MNWEVRNSANCTTDGCTAKAEIEVLREKVAALAQERDGWINEADHYREQLAAMTLERDTLNAALDAKITICGDANLAAAQARIKELREALDRLGHHEICHETCEVCKLLSTPDDSSTLDRRLQEERERICAALRKVNHFDAASIVSAIRCEGEV